ncbi:hypothetical protein GF325_15425 [Candidatus Bathyarchaeota archaeon]|nr:hypothetical protein [Candidatus Bathyarchaeota archaeon]
MNSGRSSKVWLKMVKSRVKEIKRDIEITIGNIRIGDGHPVRVMGVLNVSKESFYTGSIVNESTIAGKAASMISEGASLLDLGGRSTAPWSPSITIDEETIRVTQALDVLLPMIAVEEVLVSIDTQYVAVAREALDMFRDHELEDRFVLNDVSGLRQDPEMAGWINENEVPAIIMASHYVPGDSLGLDEIIADLKSSLSLLDKDARVITDPGIGHWIPEKEPPYDLDALGNLSVLRQLGCPILVALSRKSFIGAVLGGATPDNRYFGSLAATAVSVVEGAHVIRTHDVNPAVMDTVRVASAIRAGMNWKGT